MKRIHRRDFVSSAGLAYTAILAQGQRLSAQPQKAPPTVSKSAEGSRGAAATVHPLATEAAINCLRNGGNAIDAAVAASLMLSVVDSHNSGLGGGGLALIRLASGQTIAIDGREMAPSRSTAQQYFNSDGKPDPLISQEGPLAVAVPGLVALLHRISQEFGVISWKASLLQSASVAENGYAISANFAAVIKEQASRLRKYPSSAAILLDASGQPWPADSLLKQPDLARTLRQIADQGSDWFYRGEFAERIDKFMSDQGGYLRADDMANYQTASRDVITTRYRDRQIYGFPPPSSGGIHVAQMLAMLEPFDVGKIFRTSPATGYHLLLEVMKRALADRAYWLGDADFAKVPKGLLDAEYLKSRAASIDLARATEVSAHGVPPAAEIDLFGRGGHTTHLTTADSQGNVVALTQTVNTSFGSKVILPGTGVVLNNEMDDFSLAPGVRNAFGLVGSDANAIVPKKRPLSSMSPAIVTDSEDRPIFTCGAAGGPRIITTVLQSLVRAIDLNMTAAQALSEPRVHHQWSPNHSIIENAMPDAVVAELKRMGHEVLRTNHLATAQAISLQPQQQLFAASDPRVPSSAQCL